MIAPLRRGTDRPTTEDGRRGPADLSSERMGDLLVPNEVRGDRYTSLRCQISTSDLARR